MEEERWREGEAPEEGEKRGSEGHKGKGHCFLAPPKTFIWGSFGGFFSGGGGGQKTIKEVGFV